MDDFEEFGKIEDFMGLMDNEWFNYERRNYKA